MGVGPGLQQSRGGWKGGRRAGSGPLSVSVSVSVSEHPSPGAAASTASGSQTRSLPARPF